MGCFIVESTTRFAPSTRKKRAKAANSPSLVSLQKRKKNTPAVNEAAAVAPSKKMDGMDVTGHSPK